jgi:hypothetical protein
MPWTVRGVVVAVLTLVLPASANADVVRLIQTSMPDARVAARLVDVQADLVRAGLHLGPRHPDMRDLQRRKASLMAVAKANTAAQPQPERSRLSKMITPRYVQLLAEKKELERYYAAKHPKVREVETVLAFYQQVFAATGKSKAIVSDVQRKLRALVDRARAEGRLLSYDGRLGPKHPKRVEASAQLVAADKVLGGGSLDAAVCAGLKDAFASAMAEQGSDREAAFETDALLAAWLRTEKTCTTQP